MRIPSTFELLRAWECGRDQVPPQRALTLLATAWPDTLAELSISQRDARLLTLREATFGSHLVSLATCPDCGDSLELSFNVADIRVEPDAEPAEELALRIDGYEVHFRPPNSQDLVAIAPEADIAAARQRLLERCLLAVTHDDAQPVDGLPASVEQALVEQMAQYESQADIRLALTCPACAHQWQAVFDILSFFWTELDAWAQRTLREVHILASAYGWREAEILALSSRRRHLYLEMVNA